MYFYMPNIYAEGSVTVTGGTVVSGYPESRLYDYSRAFLWQRTGTGINVQIDVDQSSLQYAADVLIIDNTNLADATTVKLQYSSDGSSWTDQATLTITGTTHVEALTQRTSNFWRLDITGIDDPYIGELFLGPALEIKVIEGSGYNDHANVEWRLSAGGSPWAIKYGPEQRERHYLARLASADLALFEAFLGDLDDNRLSFYLQDHKDETWLGYFPDEIPASFSLPGTSRTEVEMRILESL